MKHNINRFIFPGMGGATSATAQNAVLVPPVTVGLSSQAGGALAATTYYAKTTWVNAAGETLPSAEVSLAVAINNVLVVPTPDGGVPATATGWNVYVSTATGTETKQNATPIAIGTSWVEPTTGLIAGAAVPAANTATYTLTGLVRQQVLITVTQNTWVNIGPTGKAAAWTGLLVTPSTPMETVVCPGDIVTYIQDSAAGQISIVQIAG